MKVETCVSGKERVPEIPDQLSSSRQQKRFTLHSSEEAIPAKQVERDRQASYIHRLAILSEGFRLASVALGRQKGSFHD